MRHPLVLVACCITVLLLLIHCANAESSLYSSIQQVSGTAKRLISNIYDSPVSISVNQHLFSFHKLQTTIPALNINITTDFDPSVAFNPKTTYPNDPTNYNEWLGYLFFLIIVFLAVVIGCSLLVCLCCGVCCLRCCQLCGGMRPTKSFKQGYKDRPRVIIVIPYTIICLAIALVTLVGIAFTIVFTVSISNIVQSGYDFSNNSLNLLQRIPQEAMALGGDINGIISNVNQSVAQIFDISQPVSMFRGLADRSLQKVNGMYLGLVDIQSNYTVIAEALNAIFARPEMNGQQNPAQNFNPYFDNEQILIMAQNASTQVDSLISQMQNIVGDLPNSINQGISQFAPAITNTLNSGISVINNTMNLAVGYVNQYVPESTRNSVKDGVLAGEALRMVIVCVIMASGLIIVTAGLLFMACSFKWKCCWGIWLTSALILLLPICYFVVFSFQTMAFVVVRDACEQGPAAADRAQAKLLTEDNKRTFIDTIRQQVPADISSRINWSPLYNLSITEVARDIYNCNGDQDLFDATGLNLNQIANVSSLLDYATDQVTQFMNQINVTTVLDQLKQPIQNLNFAPTALQLDYDANVTQFLSQIADLRNQLSDPAFFGYNATKANETVDNFNSFLSNRGIFVIYTLQNITSVNGSDPQFNSLSSNDKQYVDSVGNTARQLQQQYDTAVITASGLLANVTVIENSLYNILGSLNITKGFFNQILQIPQEATALIDSLASFIDDKKNQVGDIVNTVGNGVNDLISRIEGLTRCGFAADFLRDSVTSVCVPMNLSTNVLSWSNFLIGLLMLIIFPISLIAAKRFTWKWKPLEESTTVVSTTAISPVTSGLIEETTVVHEIHNIPMHDAMINQGQVHFGAQHEYSHLNETPNSPMKGEFV